MWVYAQTQNVICVLCIEPLRMFLTVVHNADGCDVIHDLARLQVEEIVAAVVTTVTESVFQVHFRHKILADLRNWKRISKW